MARACGDADHDSDVMIDKLTTVRRSSVHARVGRLTAKQLIEIERAMMDFSALLGNESR